MITENRFASSHRSFWQELLPMGEHYIRASNLCLDRFCDPLLEKTAPRHHGVINELAFRLFVRTVGEGICPSKASEEVVNAELSDTMRFISSFRQHGRGPLPHPGTEEIQEARTIAERIVEFFVESPGTISLVTRPRFRGCGWLSECEGDVLADGVLYEIKSGDRNFRMIDLRQLLIYCALDFAAKSYSVSEVCLMNPSIPSIQD